MKTVATTNAPAALGPYAQAQVSGGFVFTSGQIGIDPATGAIPDGIEAQAHQVFRNLTAVLQAVPGQKLRRGRASAQGRARRMRGHRRSVSTRARAFSPELVEFSATCCPVCAY